MDIPSPAPADSTPDHAVLIAQATLSQAASPTAMLAQRITRQRRARPDGSLGALVQLFTTHDAAAATSLDGSFHPRVARRPVGGR